MGSPERDGSRSIADAKLAAVINVLDRIESRRRKASSSHGQPRLRKEAASFQKLQIREVLESLARNREIYERRNEAKLQRDDRENIRSIWHNMEVVVMKSENLADRLLVELKRDPTDPQEIKECRTELDSNATTLTTWIASLNV